MEHKIISCLITKSRRQDS